MWKRRKEKRFAAAGRYHHRYPPRNTGRKTFRIVRPDGTKLFEHMPGQCAMVCAPGVSEGMFSITSSPTVKDYQEFSIKKCGSLTDHLHSLQVGDEIKFACVDGPEFDGHLVDFDQGDEEKPDVTNLKKDAQC